MKRKLIVCAGAGISAESGIPTFRNANGQGLWENHELMKVCYLPSFYDNYQASNAFYIERVAQFIGAKPNAAHLKVAELQADFEVFCVTSNIDTLFEQAGVDPDKVIHIHGRMDQVVTNYGTADATIHSISSSDDYQALLDKPAFYPVKPNVVFFSEAAPLYQNMRNLFSDLTLQDVVLVVGSSEQVISFAGELRDARFTGDVFFVNTDADLCLQKKKYDCATPYCGSAVEFFSQITQDKIGHYCFPSRPHPTPNEAFKSKGLDVQDEPNLN